MVCQAPAPCKGAGSRTLGTGPKTRPASSAIVRAPEGDPRRSMTYCVGMCLKDGLVMLSDSRTSAGVDNIATFRKMTVWERPDERLLCLLSAGNLGVTQTIVNHLEAGLDP